jgi:hypothetical protein
MLSSLSMLMFTTHYFANPIASLYYRWTQKRKQENNIDRTEEKSKQAQGNYILLPFHKF